MTSMKQITLTYEELAQKMVSSYNLVKKGYKTQEEHFGFVSGMKMLIGDTAYDEVCRIAEVCNSMDEQKQKRLKELEQTEAGLFEDYERELIDDDTLNFELEGISVSRSIILNKPI